MSERGIQLQQTARRQISELTDLFSIHGEKALRLLCPGREKLGDGTVAANALHTADNYHRIAGFLQANEQMPRTHAQTAHRRHRMPALLRHRNHGEDKHDDQSRHGGGNTAENVSLQALLERLSAARSAFRVLAALTDQQLDAEPPASDMKFWDGERNLEQIMTNLLKHQGHQVDALRAAVA